MAIAQKATNAQLFDGLEPQNSRRKDDGLGLTFRDSKRLPIHGWYPYVEGFAAGYIQELVNSYGESGVVYDPFGGSGTVNLVASMMGVESAFCEANPFMRFVAETKVNARHHYQQSAPRFEDGVSEFAAWVRSADFEREVRAQELGSYAIAFDGRDFFAERDLRELQACRDAAIRIAADDPALRDLFLLAISSVTVACSHMTRRADLRRRRADEYIGRVVDVRSSVLSKLDTMRRDLLVAPAHFAPAEFVGSDSRNLAPELVGQVSLVLTSPPYLNGTNYIRNTKLELWLLGFIKAERELADLNRVCMVCGINNVVKGRPAKHRFQEVEAVASELDGVSPDLRIPALVRGYFSDMLDVLQNCASYLRPDGRFVLDIGDSKFYGVHVPTHDLLVSVAKQAGLKLVEQRVLARRHSRDKTPLTQVELTFAQRH